MHVSELKIEGGDLRVAAKKVMNGNTRVTGKEQYYTPAYLADSILERATKSLINPFTYTFLEPAGGTGSFVEAAKRAGFSQIISMDIEPKHDLVRKADFLTDKMAIENAICVTNPPFGRNNSLSIPFFNKAAIHSELIAFVVPRSWRKWSVLNRLHPSFQLVDDWDLDIDYVDENGESTHGIGNLRTCVQVWKRSDSVLREPVKIPDHAVILKSTPELADVSFTLFGYGCGTVKQEFTRVPNTTQAFYKLNHPRALEALQTVDFSRFFKHTAYTEALGFQEINFLLNEYLGLETMQYSNNPLDENYLGLNHAQQLGTRDHSRIF
jgi:predicted RNA methylase